MSLMRELMQFISLYLRDETLLSVAVKLSLIMAEQGKFSIWLFKVTHRLIPDCSLGEGIHTMRKM